MGYDVTRMFCTVVVFMVQQEKATLRMRGRRCLLLHFSSSVVPYPYKTLLILPKNLHNHPTADSTLKKHTGDSRGKFTTWYITAGRRLLQYESYQCNETQRYAHIEAGKVTTQRHTGTRLLVNFLSNARFRGSLAMSVFPEISGFHEICKEAFGLNLTDTDLNFRRNAN